MLLYLRPIVLTIHILLGIIWVGGILFVGWGVYPAVKKMKILDQRFFLSQMMKHTHILFSLAGAGVIGTGILLGVTFGPINQWEDLFTTSYGSLFFAALLISIATLVWGVLISYRVTMNMLLNDQLWAYADRGGMGPLQQAM